MNENDVNEKKGALTSKNGTNAFSKNGIGILRPAINEWRPKKGRDGQSDKILSISIIFSMILLSGSKYFCSALKLFLIYSSLF